MSSYTHTYTCMHALVLTYTHACHTRACTHTGTYSDTHTHTHNHVMHTAAYWRKSNH